MTAITNRATALFLLRPGTVLTLPTALANSSEFVEPLPNIPNLDFVEALRSEMGNDVQPYEHVVPLMRLRREIGLHNIL